MTDMYLESLMPIIEGHWKSLGRNPEHLIKKKIERAELEEGISVAEKEREKYVKKNPKEGVSFDEYITALRKNIEEKKKEGKNTAILESKIIDLQNRLKPFKGKINARDAKGIKQELINLTEEFKKLW